MVTHSRCFRPLQIQLSGTNFGPDRTVVNDDDLTAVVSLLDNQGTVYPCTGTLLTSLGCVLVPGLAPPSECVVDLP